MSGESKIQATAETYIGIGQSGPIVWFEGSEAKQADAYSPLGVIEPGMLVTAEWLGGRLIITASEAD